MFSSRDYQSTACTKCTIDHVEARDNLHIHNATVLKTAVCTRGEIFAENSSIHCLSGVGNIHLENSRVQAVTLNIKKGQVGKLTLINSVIEKALFIGAEDPKDSVFVDLTAIQDNNPQRRVLITYRDGSYTVERLDDVHEKAS
ncbi:MAG: hypothetical protein KDK62_00405 [Chlamydiia bacterium]|nr:hypothetical protein [Chlamydiia bacterium]